MNDGARFRLVVVLVVAGVTLGADSCTTSGRPMPRTYAVKGKVVFPDGKPMPGGMVQLQSSIDPSMTTTGSIQEDGTFSLTTLFENKKLNGAIEGPHTVTVIPPMGPDQSAVPITLPEPITVKPEDSNNFTITVEKPSTRP
jgi:hypothetical protein